MKRCIVIFLILDSEMPLKARAYISLIVNTFRFERFRTPMDGSKERRRSDADQFVARNRENTFTADSFWALSVCLSVGRFVGWLVEGALRWWDAQTAE